MRGWLALPSFFFFLAERTRACIVRALAVAIVAHNNDAMPRNPLVSRDGNVAFVSGPQIAVSSPLQPSPSSPKTTRPGDAAQRAPGQIFVEYLLQYNLFPLDELVCLSYIYIYMVYGKECSKLYVYLRLVKRSRTNRIRFINSLHFRPFSLDQPTIPRDFPPPVRSSRESTYETFLF